MTVTKTTFPRADIHQLAEGLTWPSGISAGDIVDVTASLGHPASQMLVEGTYGGATIRLNVTEKVFGRQDAAWNVHDVQYPEFYTRPVPSGEIEVQKTDIVVPSGINLTIDKVAISDFKVVEIAPNVRITFN